MLFLFLEAAGIDNHSAGVIPKAYLVLREGVVRCHNSTGNSGVEGRSETSLKDAQSAMMSSNLNVCSRLSQTASRCPNMTGTRTVVAIHFGLMVRIFLISFSIFSSSPLMKGMQLFGDVKRGKTRVSCTADTLIAVKHNVLDPVLAKRARAMAKPVVTQWHW